MGAESLLKAYAHLGSCNVVEVKKEDEHIQPEKCQVESRLPAARFQ